MGAVLSTAGPSQQELNDNAQSCPVPGTPNKNDNDCEKINKEVQDAKAEIDRKFRNVGAACRAGMSRWALQTRKASWLRLARARSISIQRC